MCTKVEENNIELEHCWIHKKIAGGENMKENV